MTRAEEKALEFYPMKDYNKEPNYIHSCDSKMLDEVYRDVFRIGYEAAEKDLGWNSVDNSLPPMGKEVIVLTNEANGHTLPVACHLCFAHRPDPEVAVCYDGWNIPGVRYWMYCPELPEE